MKRRVFVLFIALIFVVCIFAACKDKPTVTFVAQNGTDTKVEVELDDLSKVPVFQNGDKVFGGWFTDAACTAGNEWTPTLDVSESITVYAKWTDAAPQIKSLSVRTESGSITLQKGATEASLRAQLTVVGIKEDDSSVIISDYTLQNFDATAVNREQTVTVKYGEFTQTVTVTIVDGSVLDPDELKDVFDFYNDNSDYNFQIKYSSAVDGVATVKTLSYLGANIQTVYDYNGTTYTEYLVYSQDGTYSYYEDDGSGKYTVLPEDDNFFDLYLVDIDCVYLTELADLKFLQGDGCYLAADVQKAGDAILGEWEDCTWTSLELYVADGKISKIVAVQEDVSEEYAGTYTYTLEFSKYGQVAFTVPTVGGTEPTPPQGEIVNPSVLEPIFNAYKNFDDYNFQVKYSSEVDGVATVKTLGYLGGNIQNVYSYNGTTYTEYLVYSQDGTCSYFEDDGNGKYTVIAEDDLYFANYASDTDCVYLTELSKLQFVEGDGCYLAADVQKAGDAILGEWEDCTWTSLELYVADGKITKIVAVQEDVSIEFAGTYTYTLEFSKYGQVAFTVPTVGGTDPDNPDNPDPTPPQEEVITATISEALVVGKALANDASTDKEYRISGVISSITNTTYGNGVLRDATDQGVTIEIYGMRSSDGSLRYDGMGGNAPKVGDTVTLVGKIKKYNGVVEIINAKVVSRTQGTTEQPSTGNVMPAQTYNPATFDSDNLQDKMRGSEGYSIGLPSSGTYSALVVPVQFSNYTLTAADLQKLNKAFNGTGADTGWESVASYYKKSSYGALNLSFDIWGVNIGTAGTPFVSANSSSYYETYQKTVTDYDGKTYKQDGAEALMLEVLTYLQNNGIDLNKYDTNDDGVIDAVYIIYSAPVNYTEDDSMWWAYVTWYYGTETYGNEISPYYYLFAGFDFMDEDADTDEGYESSGIISGLKVNASTFIHETGHLLGLDDYYDYDSTQGSNRGLGGADMMDATVGDHGVYSKIMLGWIEPKIITTTQTFTIDLSDEDTSNDCVMLLLDSNNSYFCEYLLIDLYSATGLNALHAGQTDSYLYGGANFGARIYHVTNQCDNGYSDEYGSFTNCNNTLSAFALIKLVEADGGNSTSTMQNGAWAAESDLWQTGDTLKGAFPSYARNDGKTLNFDVSFDSVTATSATITVTFVA